MMFRKVFWLFLLGGLFIGCSKDDSPRPSDTTSNIPNFIVVGEDIESIYQYNFVASNDEGELINLTETSNVDRQYITLRQVDDQLTFYSFSSGSFSAVQQNVFTGEQRSLENFYVNTEERAIVWGTNSVSKLFLANYSPVGSTNFGIRIIDIDTREEEDLTIEFGIRNTYQPVYHRGHLIAPYKSAQSTNKIAFIDTESNSILSTLDFGNSIPSILIDEDDNIVIITGGGDNNYSYDVYDPETLEVIEQGMSSLDQIFLPGPLQGGFINGRLYYRNAYAQPSLVSFGPAVFDFDTTENNITDMIAIVEALQTALQKTITLTAFSYVADSNTFLIGYAILTEEENLEGGVLVITAGGELIKIIPTPFAPTYFLK